MTQKSISAKTNHRIHPNHHHHRRPPLFSLQRMRLSIILLLASCVFLFVLFEIRLLKTPLMITSQASLLAAWDFIPQLRNLNAFATDANCSTARGEADNEKFRQAVTFLPLIDVRYHKNAEDGNTWFMSSLSDKQEEGEAQYQKFPSEASDGRLLCIKGLNADNGAWNSYALAWPETLPYNATLMKGLTIVSNNHFGHENMWYNTWHGLSPMVPIVSWHIKNGCTRVPPAPRFVLYHRGELRTKMGKWIKTLMEATFNGPLNIEGFDFLGDDGGGGGDDQAVCFEEAVVFRRNEKLMAVQRRKEAYGLIRCKAWGYCNVSLAAVEGGGGGGRSGGGGIGMTLLFRTGARSFKNETAVVGIFEKECKKVEGCQLRVTHSDNLTVCEQVKLVSVTDIMVSPHGAQLTNMILMKPNSTVMEIFPKGWLELGGVGQYVYHWLASWSGMNHPGVWRDSEGDPVPYKFPDNDHFMSLYKNTQIGHNETYLSAWARDVLNDVKQRKLVEGKEKGKGGSEYASGCACSAAEL